MTIRTPNDSGQGHHKASVHDCDGECLQQVCLDGYSNRFNLKEHAMDKSTMLDQAQRIMTRYVCRGLDQEESALMEDEIQRFFEQRVSTLGKSEIMDRMRTPMQALAWFNTYRCLRYWDNCCSNVMPEYADACNLAS
jgi:hypothetical protein